MKTKTARRQDGKTARRQDGKTLQLALIACLGTFASATGFAQQDDLRENGPYEQRYFARERGAAVQPYVPQLPAQPSVSFQAEKDGKSNELIVLLEYGQTARLQTLLGAAGKAETTATPAGLESTVLAAINNKSSPLLTSVLQAPAHARYLLNVERLGDEARARGAKVNAPRERLERFMVLRYSSVALSPIYRMSWKCGDDTPLPPAICAGRPEHIDTVLVGESEIGYFQYAGYKVDGLEGYSYPKTLPQPAGTVRLIRKYNVARDDHAIFPETAWPTMQSQGYTQNTNTTDWLGYVYPNTGSMPVIQ